MLSASENQAQIRQGFEKRQPGCDMTWAVGRKSAGAGRRQARQAFPSRRTVMLHQHRTTKWKMPSRRPGTGTPLFFYISYSQTIPALPPFSTRQTIDRQGRPKNTPDLGTNQDVALLRSRYAAQPRGFEHTPPVSWGQVQEQTRQGFFEVPDVATCMGEAPAG